MTTCFNQLLDSVYLEKGNMRSSQKPGR